MAFGLLQTERGTGMTGGKPQAAQGTRDACHDGLGRGIPRGVRRQRSGRLFQDLGERPEFVTGRPQVDGPDGATVAAEGEQPDVALPRVEAVALAGAIGFDVQCDAGRPSQIGGHPVEVTADGADKLEDN